MYIEQAYTRKYDFVKYLPIPIFFFLLMLINYAATLVMGTDTDKLIHEMIKQQGEMSVFIQTVAHLGAFLIVLLIWVRLVHRQSLTSLTTARPAISEAFLYLVLYLGWPKRGYDMDCLPVGPRKF